MIINRIRNAKFHVELDVRLDGPKALVGAFVIGSGIGLMLRGAQDIVRQSPNRP